MRGNRVGEDRAILLYSVHDTITEVTMEPQEIHTIAPARLKPGARTDHNSPDAPDCASDDGRRLSFSQLK